jgi:hypothetical protein
MLDEGSQTTAHTQPGQECSYVFYRWHLNIQFSSVERDANNPPAQGASRRVAQLKAVGFIGWLN